MTRHGKAPRTDADRGFDEQVGQRIRQCRREIGLTQSALAKAAGVTFQQVQKYEKGTNRVAASRLAVIAKALGVKAQRLMGEEPEEAAALAEEERGLLVSYRRMTSSQQVLLAQLARSMVDDARSATA